MPSFRSILGGVLGPLVLLVAGQAGCDAPGASGSCTDFPTAPACVNPGLGSDTIGGDPRASDTAGGATSEPPSGDTSGPGLLCPAGTKLCDGGCAFYLIDTNNCGECGHVCEPTVAGSASCDSGQCAPRCPGGYTECDGRCVDLSNDASACGYCGHVCQGAVGGSATCSGGSCQGPCNAWQSTCSVNGADTCVDLQNDPSNCGWCGHQCGAPVGGSPGCSAGQCVGACPWGQAACNGSCIDVQSDLYNCGGCGVTCDGFAASHGLTNATAANPEFACWQGKCTGKLSSTARETCSSICGNAGLSCVAPDWSQAATWWQECPAVSQNAAGAYWDGGGTNHEGGCKVYGWAGLSVAYSQGCDSFAPSDTSWFSPFPSQPESELQFYAMWCTCQ